MAKKKISELPAGGALNGTELVPIVQTGTTKRITAQDIANLGNASGVEGSGTINYLAKFTATSTIGNSQIFDNGTSIGINTATPNASYRLDVNGYVRGTYLAINSALGGNIGLQYSGADDWAFGENSGEATRNFNIYNFNRTAIELSINRATGAATFSGSVTSNNNTNGQIAISPASNISAAAFNASNAGGGCYFGKNNSTGGAFTGTAYATVVYSGGDVPMSFYTNDVEQMRITGGGNLGLGTTAPTNYPGYKTLSINNTSGGVLQLKVNDVSALNIFSDSTQSFLYEARNLPLAFYTNATERMRITSAGNVGIGTATPTTFSLAGKHLEVFGGSDFSFIHNNTTTVKSFFATNEGSLLSALFTFSNHALTFGTNNTERMRIAPSGNVLIGTTTDIASSKLTIESTTQGVLVPRMTTTQINNINLPATGLIAYNTTLGTLCFYDGSGWRKVSHSAM